MAPWRRLAFALFAVSFGTNVPTPLLLLYRQRLHLSATELTAIFGMYAAGLVPAIFVSGPTSDRLGRRPVTLPFMALALVSTLVFIPAANTVWLLFFGRFLQGLVSGVVFSVATAWLTELSDPSRPDLAGRRASVAMTLGFSLGPLTAGVLAQWAPVPIALPYAVHLALMSLGLVAVWPVPETLRARARGPLLALRLRPGSRGAFWLVVAPVAVAVYSFASVPISVLPLLLPRQPYPLAFTGLIGAVTLGAGTLAALQTRRLRSWGMSAGVAAGVVGYLLCLFAVLAGSPLLALAAATALGLGNGLALATGLALTQRLADPTARGALTSVFYALAYVGFAAPFLVATLDRHGGAELAFTAPAATFAALAGWLLVSGRRLAAQAAPA